MVTTPYGLNDPTKPPVREPYKCIVKGCENNAESGSVTMLCMECCHVIATGDMVWYYANYTGKNWISDTVSKIVHLKQDKQDLQTEVDELKKEFQEAYILEDNTALSLDDLRRFYHENKKYKGPSVIEDYTRALENERKTNEKLTKENEALKERVEFLEKERNALVHNMDHAYNLGNGKFLTLDDLHTFYTDNKNVHTMLERQRHHITLLELQLKQLQKPKYETFSTMPREEFEKRAEAAAFKAAENVKFDMYTEGFRRGFDMGYEKAKDQYYE